MKGIRACRFLLLPLPVFLLAGCVTHALWEDGTFARYHQPASPPNVLLFDSATNQDLLVVFDEVRDTDGKQSRRAYWARQNAPRIAAWKAPYYFSGPPDPQWPLVPVFPPGAAPGLSDTNRLYALLAADGRTFTLLSPTASPMIFDLPVYRDVSGRTKQVLLTPLAVIADVTIVGGVIAFVTMPIWWQSLNCAVE